MGREQQTSEVQRKVVAAALRLFLAKGYAQTTLREISEVAGVSYGSIYHHFEDKDGIFLELVMSSFETAQVVADRALVGAQDAYVRLALKWAGLIRAASDDRRVAELLSVAYRSWKITEAIVLASTRRHWEWLGPELPDWSENRFLAATLVLKGAVSSVVDEKLNRDQLSADERIEAVLAAALPGFGASPEITRQVTQKVLRLAEALPESALRNLVDDQAESPVARSAKRRT